MKYINIIYISININKSVKSQKLYTHRNNVLEYDTIKIEIKVA